MGDFLPYGRQLIEDDDVDSVGKVLRSDMLTTGPVVELFEERLANAVGADHAVVCNSGTAALYLAARPLLKTGDYAIVPSITFVATASAFQLAGVEICFSDVDPNTGIMTAEHMAVARERTIASGIAADRIKCVVPVHLAGRVDGIEELSATAAALGMLVVEDACHALGTTYANFSCSTGACVHSSMTCFSFHPVKTIAMEEGGAVTTNSARLAEHARRFRNHGMTRDPGSFQSCELALDSCGKVNPWYYEVDEISHNFRASDINCALGLSQLGKMERLLGSRRKLMERYRERLRILEPMVRFIRPLAGTEPGWHLCTVLIDFHAWGIERARLMENLRAAGIGTQVHYIPVHAQPYYKKRYGTVSLPGAMNYYDKTLSLPLHPSMTTGDVDRVVDALGALTGNRFN